MLRRPASRAGSGSSEASDRTGIWPFQVSEQSRGRTYLPHSGFMSIITNIEILLFSLVDCSTNFEVYGLSMTGFTSKIARIAKP